MRIPFLSKKKEDKKTYHQQLAEQTAGQLKKVGEDMDSLKKDAKDARKLSKKSLQKSVKIEEKVSDLVEKFALIIKTPAV